jgi:anthranilate 1,2-dioxygenase reductase subunit
VALTFADGATHFVDVHEHETLFEAALRNAIVLPVDCREGVCGTCRGVCVAGEYSLDFAHEDALNARERAAGAVLSCQMRPQSSCIVQFDFDSSRVLTPQPRRTHPARVHAIERVCESVAVIELALDSDTTLHYLPGQYAHLRVPGTEATRSYSFATAPRASALLKFIVRLQPSGAMSDYLRSRAAPGDRIDLEGPFGSFYLRKRTRPVLMLAGGTGIAAFLGMIDELHEACGPPVTLLYGVNDATEFCELHRLQACAASNAEFEFHCIANRAPAHWSGPRGLVTDLIAKYRPSADGVDVYACGPPGMVAAAREALQDSSLDIRFYCEKFAAS